MGHTVENTKKKHFENVVCMYENNKINKCSSWFLLN